MFLPFPSLSTELALLPSLLLLETVLSADNALVLASLLKRVESSSERQHLLNWGMATAIVLRIVAVGAAGVMLQLPLVRLLGGCYLVWLALHHFWGELTPGPIATRESFSETPADSPARSGVSMVLLMAGTNLVFSLDSICAALALTDNLPLVMLAGAMGVVVLRWVAGWLLNWMERFPNLANAGYLIVLAVGLRLVVEQMIPVFSPPDLVLFGGMGVLLGWGFLHPQAAKP